MSDKIIDDINKLYTDKVYLELIEKTNTMFVQGWMNTMSALISHMSVTYSDVLDNLKDSLNYTGDNGKFLFWLATSDFGIYLTYVYGCSSDKGSRPFPVFHTTMLSAGEAYTVFDPQTSLSRDYVNKLLGDTAYEAFQYLFNKHNRKSGAGAFSPIMSYIGTDTEEWDYAAFKEHINPIVVKTGKVTTYGNTYFELAKLLFQCTDFTYKDRKPVTTQFVF